MQADDRSRPQGRLEHEYRRAKSDPIRVRLFPDETFESTLPAPPEIGRGEQRLVQLRDGLGLVASRLSVGPEGFVSVSHHPGLVHVAFNLSDTAVKGKFDGARELDHSLRGDTYILSPQTFEATRIPPFGAIRFLDPVVLPSDFVLFIDDLQARIPADLLGALAGYRSGSFLHKSRMTPEMYAVIEGIDRCPFQGSLKKLYLEGKILELLALRLAQLADTELRRPTARAFGSRQVERLHEARAIVARRMEAPPSLHDLSKQVAMSTTLLKRGFRELFGESVFQHLRNLRLERARQMLREEGASVKEAAFAVGYASLSHFAKAFRQRFGASPRVWARDASAGATPSAGPD